MKISNFDASQSLQVMRSTQETGKLGFAIAKNARKLTDELEEYDAKRNELIARYGTPDTKEDGKYHFTPEQAKEFNAALKEYDRIEFEFSPMRVPEEVFFGGKLNSDQMYVLMWMCEE